MAVQLTINGITYNFPEQGENPPWGEDVQAWASAVTEVLGNVVGLGDIIKTTFALTNDQSTPANITSLSFDTSTIRSAIVEYSIYRTSDSAEVIEQGNLYLTYSSDSNDWTLGQTYIGSESGITFSITSDGQVQYISSDLGTNHNGQILFKATAFSQ